MFIDCIIYFFEYFVREWNCPWKKKTWN